MVLDNWDWIEPWLLDAGVSIFLIYLTVDVPYISIPYHILEWKYVWYNFNLCLFGTQSCIILRALIIFIKSLTNLAGLCVSSTLVDGLLHLYFLTNFSRKQNLMSFCNENFIKYRRICVSVTACFNWNSSCYYSLLQANISKILYL